MREIFDEIYQALLNGQEITVATIISDRGSTPRNSGSKMIVYRNSIISGTIGGGAIEGDVIQRALRLFETPAETAGVRKQRKSLKNDLFLIS